MKSIVENYIFSIDIAKSDLPEVVCHEQDNTRST